MPDHAIKGIKTEWWLRWVDVHSMPHLGGNEENKPHVSHGVSIRKLVTQDGTKEIS